MNRVIFCTIDHLQAPPRSNLCITASDVEVAGITRDAEVNATILTYHPDRDQAAEKAAAHADLASIGIIVR